MNKVKTITKHLLNILPQKQICTQYIDRFAKGTDAGFYRLVPELVVIVNSEKELQTVLSLAWTYQVPVTFKAGGTSLSGQTITDSLLIEIGPDFCQYTILDGGKKIVLQPGVRGGYINQQLAKYCYKIGPSPASINSAKIGGIVANNASGASYGIATNSYNTIEAMRIVMADGTLLITNDKHSRQAFAKSHKSLLDEISEIKQQIQTNQTISETINQKYKLKNTTGYGMNAFMDFDDPIDILMHLMVGSEGTLGFISEVTMRTIKDLPYKTCSLIFLPGIVEAAKCIIPLRLCRVSAAELMDRNALHAVENVDGMPSVLKSLPEAAAVLLVETSAASYEELVIQQEEIIQKLSGVKVLYPIEFTTNTKDYNTYWKVRKGLFTSAAATRPAGTTCIIEDVAFPGEELHKALPALQELINAHQYQGSVMWGHLLDGNIHFLIMPDFKEEWQMDNYKKFMHNLAQQVVNRFNGSLKAEHGTGRNMAPFVEYEWGTEIYHFMKRVKLAFDPKNILNPGVIINEDAEVHTKNIKPLPEVHPLIDNCIECGFCESSCPSRELTLTPRQRITVYRVLNGKKAEISTKDYKSLQKSYSFNGEESCATDGLCALNCPVNIDTGKLIKALRSDQRGRLSNSFATIIANNFGAFLTLAKGALKGVSLIQRILPLSIMEKGSAFVHHISGRNIPLWNKHMPGAAVKVNTLSTLKSNDKVVYFPACINRMMGNDMEVRDKQALTRVTGKLLNKGGYEVIYPNKLSKLCCGMAFDSKGFKEQGIAKLHELEQVLLEVSANGKYPVLCDMSPCLLRMKEHMDKRLKLYEPIEFTLKYLKEKLVFKQQEETVMIHSTCSSTKMGLDNQLLELAKLCATEVIKPEKTGCCGWAGDKGFNLPELNKTALRYLKEEVPERAVAGYSNSRTCEIGLSQHSGINYQSILYLVDKASE